MEVAATFVAAASLIVEASWFVLRWKAMSLGKSANAEVELVSRTWRSTKVIRIKPIDQKTPEKPEGMG
jgi:hypothetical protein